MKTLILVVALALTSNVYAVTTSYCNDQGGGTTVCNTYDDRGAHSTYCNNGVCNNYED